MEKTEPLSLNTRITVAALVVIVPMFGWAARLDGRVERLEQERAEMRQELHMIQAKLDDIRSRIPLQRP
jgi:hypothetical protein